MAESIYNEESIYEDYNYEHENDTSFFDFCNLDVNVSGPRCQKLDLVYNGLYFYGILPAAVLIIIIQGLLTRRTRRCTKLCWGHPGIAIPINMLDTSAFRIIYTLIFGIMSSTVLSAVLEGPKVFWEEPKNSILKKLVDAVGEIFYIIYLAGLYYPMFACVDSAIPLVGFLLGSAYSVLWLTDIVLGAVIEYYGCYSGCRATVSELAILALENLPDAACSICVVLWFSSHIVMEIIRLLKSPKPWKIKIQEGKKSDYHEQRVTNLLKRNQTQKKKTKWSKLLYKIYPYQKGFQFPLRFLVAMFTTFLVIYQLSFTILDVVIYYSIFFEDLQVTIVASWISFDLAQVLNPTTLISIYDIVDALAGTDYVEQATNGSGPINVTTVESYADIAVNTTAESIEFGSVILPLASVLAMLAMFVILFLTFRAVSLHLQKASKGDLSFLPSEMPPFDEQLKTSMEYVGFQIAYFVWGTILFNATFMAIGMGVALFVYLVTLYPEEIIIDLIVPVVIGLLWAQALAWMQKLLCTYVFTKKKDGSAYLSNRRLYHWMTYLLLFQNLFVGILSAALRVLLSMVFGFLLITRLDRVLFMKGFEDRDDAHGAYIGFLVLDYTQNNSIMRVFCKLLVDKQLQRRAKTQKSIGAVSYSKETVSLEEENVIGHPNVIEVIPENQIGRIPRVSQRAYNRWMVAYTLIRNESLIPLTGNSLKEKRESARKSFYEQEN